MRLPFLASCEALARPGAAFAEPPGTLGRAVWRMVRVWVPLALLNAAGTAWRALEAYTTLRRGAAGRAASRS
jgi:hypothetical protein